MYSSWSLLYTILFFITLYSDWTFGLVDSNAAPTTSRLHSKPIRKVAIIGAGSAGSSTSYHLQKFASEAGLGVDITVYERSSFVGGRSTTVNAYDDPTQPVELGATVFVDINYILKNATEHFGLNYSQTKREPDDDLLGIWNGEAFVFKQKESGWSYWDLARMFWKYGFAPRRTQTLMQKAAKQFGFLYEPPFFPFRSLTNRAIDLGLSEFASVTGRQLLNKNSIGEPFATEIIQASTRVNYAQNLDHIHGLETMVCMAIQGAGQIEGGNWQIFDQMLQAANATVNLNTTVYQITKQNGRYRVKTSGKNGNSRALTHEEDFDTVVLAGPLQYSNINMENNLLRHIPDEIPYVKLHVTLFSSSKTLSAAYFNHPETEPMPNTILTTLPPNSTAENLQDDSGPAGFFSISTLRTVINPKTKEKEFLYKIFSPTALTSEFLSGILGTPVPDDLGNVSPTSGEAITWYYPHVFHSYPLESPRVTFEEIELARGFYYTSGIESFISSMETSALMGMNVAQLIVNDYLELLVDKKAMEDSAQFQQAVLQQEL